MAARFVAGETLAEAIGAIRRLNDRGIHATLDHLGENTAGEAAARQATDEVLAMLAAIDQAGVQANVSIKLSQMGLAISPELCRENLARMLRRAEELHNFIRIDMEGADLTEATLEQYFWARQAGYQQVGIVIQSYLLRSAGDIARIMAEGGRVRLCKGAYQESPRVAYPRKADVDENYDRLVAALFDGVAQAGLPRISPDGRIPPIPALATHDERRIQQAQAAAGKRNLPKDALEFQMLYGIRRDLQEKLAGEGYPVRVYVPYGTHWYPYFMRRLAERPANVWFFISNYFRK
jgi:proline dehydrogenase